MRASASLRVAVIGLALACGTCGGSSSSKPPCPPDSPDSPATAFAAESALIARGRADADFAHALGADSQQLLDAADAARAALLQQIAAEQGVVLPTAGTGSTGCAPATATVKRGAILSLTVPAMVYASGLLALAASGVPLSGMTPSSPMIKTDAGTAADGSPTQTVTTIDTTFGGHDSTAVVMLTMSTSINANGKWTTEAVTVNATINVCPDSGGTAPGTYDMTVDGAAGSGSTAASTYHAEIHDAFYFVVNDSAQVASEVDTSAFTYHATGARDANAGVSATANFIPGMSVQSGPTTVTADDGSADTAKLVRQCLFTFGLFTAAMVKDPATSKWRGGTCVDVHVNPGSEMVDKNAQLMISAQPYHKFEMANINAPVVAMMSGVQSLNPQGMPVPAPAMFTYVAGSKFKDQGVVTFKSTSKRGIGTASATYTVKCDDTMMCPEGKKLNLETCMCECQMKLDCPAGQQWNDQTCMCECAPKACPGNQVWDPQSCQCVCNLQTCPAGKTLNPDLCECETTCQIDDVTHTIPLGCVFVGTAHVSASGGGQMSDATGGSVTWSLSYDASLSVTEQDAAKSFNLSGGVTGQYNEVEVLVDNICTSTLTTDESVSSLGQHATLLVAPQGDGTFMIFINVDASYEGTFTVTGVGDCGPDSTDMTGVGFGNFFGSGPASGSTFTGSNDDAAPSDLTFPNGEPAKYHLVWSLHLIQQ